MPYQTLALPSRPFLALTGLIPAAFRDLLAAFEAAGERADPSARTAAGQPRQRGAGAGRHSALLSSADKLLFVLVSLKTYPLPVVLGQLFGISTSGANYWLPHLLPVLRSALDDLGVSPERDGAQVTRRPVEPEGSGLVLLDGTEWRRPRPNKADKQALHFRGTKKTHTDTNVLLASASDDHVKRREADKGGEPYLSRKKCEQQAQAQAQFQLDKTDQRPTRCEEAAVRVWTRGQFMRLECSGS